MILLTTGCATSKVCAAPALPDLSEGGLTRTAYRAQSKDELCLQAYEWKAAPPAPVKANVVVVHGLRDHAARYGALAAALTAQGYAVYGQDHRGHGASAGARQRFDSIDDLVADVALVVAEAQKRNPGVPTFLYGHSLGGLVTAHYVLLHPTSVKGVILSGAALKLLPSVSGFQRGAARFFGAVAPGLPAQELDDTVFVHDAKAKAEMASDDRIDHSNLPARSASATLSGLEVIGAQMEQVKVPLLILHGEADVTTNIEGSQELHRRAGSTDKTLKLYPGVAHDLLHETQGPSIIAEVAEWVNRHL
jgi:alpha-beta hydrolase superfamily lysophospholipase